MKRTTLFGLIIGFAATALFAGCKDFGNWKKIYLYPEAGLQSDQVKLYLTNHLTKEQREMGEWSQPIGIVYGNGQTYSAMFFTLWEEKESGIVVKEKWRELRTCFVAYKAERLLADARAKLTYGRIDCSNLKKANSELNLPENTLLPFNSLKDYRNRK